MTLGQLFQEFQNNPIALIIFCVCSLFIFYYAYLEGRSLKAESFKDYKSIIISIGICGTFIGIFISLFSFDPQNIEKSVPELLGGLKLAFSTSIVGMLFSIILSHRENSLSKSENQSNSSEKDILKSILETNVETNGVLTKLSQSIEKSNLRMVNQLVSTESSISNCLKPILAEQKMANSLFLEIKNKVETINDNMLQSSENIDQHLNKVQRMVNQLVSTESSISNCLKPILAEQKMANSLFLEIKNKVETINDNMLQSSENIDQHLNKVHTSLKQALEELSKGASEAVVTALKQVITDFNDNLTEQFGDNFKQLNEAVYKMIKWQENYKVAITQVEENLQNIQTQIEQNSSWVERFAEDYKKISKVHQDLREIIETNQHQIDELENGLSNLHEAGQGADLLVKSMENFSSKIRSSIEEQSTALNNQSESLRTQSDNLRKELESSLGNLNTALVSLTNKFREEYKGLLEQHKELLLNFKRSA